MEHDVIEFLDRLVRIAWSSALDTCRQLHRSGRMAMDFADPALKAWRVSASPEMP